MTDFRPTWVDVDLDAIRHNVRTLKPRGSELMAVVKANAYGHGDVGVAGAALDAGATWLGVALVEEGIALRLAGIDAPILVLSECPPGGEAVAIAHRLTPTLYTDGGLQRLADAARGPVGVHVKVDTGMHRVGVWPPEATQQFVERVSAAGLDLEGLWTHFARAEEDELTTKEQLTRFLAVVDDIRAAGHQPRVLHAANSGATILHPDTHLDLVRPGIAMYGVPPGPGVGSWLGLKPALAWRSRVSLVKQLSRGERLSYGLRYRLTRNSTIATVPIGYADGYPRSLSSKAEVLIGGQRCKVAGSVTMDQILVDCGKLDVAPGDEVVVIGRQGDEEITVEELAGRAGTIGYEIVSRIGERVPREHH